MSALHPTQSELSTKALVYKAWHTGNLRFLMRGYQEEIYDMWMNADAMTTTVINMSRQMGKSYGLVIMLLMLCLKQPGTIVKYAATNKGHVREIIEAILPKVLETKPDDVKIEYKRTGSRLVFGNKSKIIFVGLNDEKSINALRGTPAHYIVIDEAGFVEQDLNYIVDSVCYPQFKTTKGKMIMISTPPVSLSHPYATRFIPSATLDKIYKKLTINDDPTLTDEDREQIMKPYHTYNAETGELVSHAVDNITFRREFLCEVVGDTTRAIIPEWQLVKGYATKGSESKKLDPISKEDAVFNWFDLPAHCYPIVSADFGFIDHTGVLFGWVDFIEQKLMVRKEIFVNHALPSDIAVDICKIARELFPNYSFKDIKWRADGRPTEIGEIRKQTKDYAPETEGLSFQPAEKHDSDGSTASLRTRIGKGQVYVHSDCKNLLAQLEHGVWNKKFTEWERHPDLGHCDLIAALKYMNRTAPWKSNPEPEVKTVDDVYFKDAFKTVDPIKKKGWGKLSARSI